jgi:hypothetical protein
LTTNQEYFDRWEQSAPTPVAGTLTPEEIAKHQGTRLKTDAPWETYGEQLGQDDPALLEAIAEYAGRVSDAAPSNEALETLAERKEFNDKTAQEYQWLDKADYADEGARIGRVLHSSTVVRLLQKAGVNCWTRTHPQAGKVTLVVQRESLHPEVGAWMQIGFMPELTVFRFDEHNIPTTEKYRGWRTVTLQLILKGILTEKKANEVFGKPGTTPAFHRYNSLLQAFRNQGGRLEE